jgi:predicted PurR-regulated permease PerM
VGIVWVPMALYLLASGAVAKGLALAAIGVGVISTVDNVVRPVLVGRDTRIPDYMVLVALGGFELMGFNGFVLGPVIAALFIAAWRMVAELEDEGEVS